VCSSFAVMSPAVLSVFTAASVNGRSQCSINPPAASSRPRRGAGAATSASGSVPAIPISTPISATPSAMQWWMRTISA
jgi:hypothetical protein